MKKLNGSDTEGLMNTIIGKDTVITGTVDVKGALRVDGSVKGKIICSDCVTVGSTGIVEAEVESKTAIVAGKMHGDIVTTEKIELQTNCEMDGDLRTKSLVIEQGALFCGACNMKGTKPDLGFLPPPVEKSEKVAASDKAKGK
ncbi:MAG: polymer-forming cytoskeletal protein [candidate division Zixibacteria bacterium]|nr:polymer-forming cytoskeletal protein [candidate division Zixibacteria bacterium]